MLPLINCVIALSHCACFVSHNIFTARRQIVYEGKIRFLKITGGQNVAVKKIMEARGGGGKPRHKTKKRTPKRTVSNAFISVATVLSHCLICKETQMEDPVTLD